MPPQTIKKSGPATALSCLKGTDKNTRHTGRLIGKPRPARYAMAHNIVKVPGMKKLLLLIAIAILALAYIQQQNGSLPEVPVSSPGADDALQRAYTDRQSDVQVQGKGVVIRLLRDDRDGSRHQRFILRLASGQTLMVAHNIDLAPRLDRLRTGDTVEFYGEYEWNEKGGILHWTHHDPAGRHIDGWLKHDGRTYQ